MMIFWLSSVVLSLLAVTCILWSGFKKEGSIEDQEPLRKSTNVSLFEEGLKELNDLRAQNEITESDYQKQRTELEDLLLEDVQIVPTSHFNKGGIRTLFVLSIVAIVLTFILYEIWGNADKLALTQAMQQAQNATTQESQAAALSEMRSRLKKDVEKYPENFDSWYLLGELYLQQQQYASAVEAFGKAVSLRTTDADALAQYAQALYFAGDKKLTFAVTSTAEQAVKLDPQQPTALGLLGITAFENKQYAHAIEYWQRVLWVVGEQDAGAIALRSGIEHAKSLLKAQQQWPFIRVTLSFSPSLALADYPWVWIYARKPGERQPVAVLRFSSRELPEVIELDDASAMPNGAKLSKAGSVEVVVRLSKSDTVVAQPDDKQVVSSLIKPSFKGTNLLLKLH